MTWFPSADASISSNCLIRPSTHPPSYHKGAQDTKIPCPSCKEVTLPGTLDPSLLDVVNSPGTMAVYSKWIGTIIDHHGLKYICFNHMVTTYILTSMVMFLMTLINISSSPRLASVAMSALMSLFVVTLSIKFAYQMAHSFKTQFELR